MPESQEKTSRNDSRFAYLGPGFGLVTREQRRVIGTDLAKVQDPRRSGAWIVSDVTTEVRD